VGVRQRTTGLALRIVRPSVDGIREQSRYTREARMRSFIKYRFVLLAAAILLSLFPATALASPAAHTVVHATSIANVQHTARNVPWD
jgi:hypothetical protein